MIRRIIKGIINVIRDEITWFKIRTEQRTTPLTPPTRDYMRVAR